MRRTSLVLLWVLICAQTWAQEIPYKAQQYKVTLRNEYRRAFSFREPVDSVSIGAGTVHQESRWNPRAQSSYAKGLTQFTDQTWDWIQDIDPVIAEMGDVWNPVAALRAMTTYHAWLWQRVKAQTDEDRWAGVLSAYNGGLGWYQRDRKLAGTEKYFGGIDRVNAGRAASSVAENRHYVDVIWRKWSVLYRKSGW